MNIQEIVIALRGQDIDQIKNALNMFTIKYGNVRESQLNYILALYDDVIKKAYIYRADKSEMNLDAYKDAKARSDKEIERQESKKSIVDKF